MIPIGNGFRVLACALALSPGVARAQATVRPFDELQTLLRPETLVVVTDDTGSETRGRVQEVSATSLTIVEVEWRQNGPLWGMRSLGTTRRFEEGRVAEVARLNGSGGKSDLVYRRNQGFVGLRFSLKPGTRVVLTDRAGRKTAGTVAEVSPTSLVLSTRGASSAPSGVGRLQQVSARQATFTESDVAEIRTPDGLGNGVAIGVGLGAGLGYLLAAGVALANESVASGMVAWLGAAVGGGLLGAAIDRSMVRGPVVYSSPQATRSARVVPLLRRDEQGVLVSMRF